jgi:hypothetical protein
MLQYPRPVIQGYEQFVHELRHCAVPGEKGRNGLMVGWSLGDYEQQLVAKGKCCEQVMLYYYKNLQIIFDDTVKCLNRFRFSLCCKIIQTTKNWLVCVLRCYSVGVHSPEIHVPISDEADNNCTAVLLEAVQKILPTLQAYCQNFEERREVSCDPSGEADSSWFLKKIVPKQQQHNNNTTTRATSTTTHQNTDDDTIPKKNHDGDKHRQNKRCRTNDA